VIWVYAICERPDVPPPVRAVGLTGAPLEGIREGELLAVLSRHADLGQTSSLDALWAHERVVERLMAERAVLPMRFGSKLAGEAALRRAIATHHDELIGALDRVRGMVELAVRAMREGGPADTDVSGAAGPSAAERHPSGRDYLRAKLELRDREEAAGAALHGPLAALAVTAKRRSGLAPGELLHAAYLVERPAVAEFRAAAQRLEREHQDVAVLCTGPWPPYSFVEVDVGSDLGAGVGG
jgi:Gas vesicle synthesis protein GvpL/GvpF